MKNELGKNWTEVELKEIISFVVGGDWGKEENFESEEYTLSYCIRGSEIKNWNKDFGSTAVLRKLKKSSIETRKLLKKDILLEISGGGPEQPVGRVVYIENNSLDKLSDYPIVCTNFLRLLRPIDKIESKYLFRYLEKFYFSGEVINYQGGSNNLRNLKYKEFEKIKIPLPPLPEQERIVAKLDALFAQHEAMKKALERIPQLLKDFRQQVLTQATNGKLTEEWRKTKKFKTADDLFEEVYKFKFDWAKTESSKDNKEAKRLLSKIRKIKAIPIDTLPKQWGYFSLSDINHLVVDCHNKTAPYQDTGIYLIRTTNIKNGEIILKDIRFVSDETYQFWSKRCIPESGDIIFTREAPMGEAAIIPENMKICLGQRTMLIRTPKNILENKYVLYCLLSNEMKAQINKKAIGTGVKHLRVGDVEDLLIPIPPYLEQQEIVSRVESLFAKADTIEKRYKTLKEKIDSLPQAILHKAFKGKLVSQLPTDGDAKNLLEEIIKLKKEVKKK